MIYRICIINYLISLSLLSVNTFTAKGAYYDLHCRGGIMTEDEILEELLKKSANEVKIKYGLIRIGDFISVRSDRRFTFTGLEYISKGKRYRVIGKYDIEGKGKAVITESNFRGENAYHSMYAVDKIYK